MKKIIFILSLITVFGVACKKDDNQPTIVVDDAPPKVVDTLGAGPFTGFAHELSGAALLVKDTNDIVNLYLQNFNMTPGPDVFLYLSKTNNYSASNVLEVARFESGFSNSNINYPVKNAEYNAEYKFVLVYCVEFHSLFGYTELK